MTHRFPISLALALAASAPAAGVCREIIYAAVKTAAIE